VWSLESGEQVRQLDGHTNRVFSVCVTADGKHVVSGSDDKTVRVWSLENGSFVRFGDASELAGESPRVGSFSVSAFGKSVIVKNAGLGNASLFRCGRCANTLSFEGCTFAGLEAPVNATRLIGQLTSIGQ
jgi:hypothetical protein